jgi:hypothetical protein
VVAKEGLAVGKEVAWFRQPQPGGNHLPHMYFTSPILASKCSYITGEGIVNILWYLSHTIELRGHKILNVTHHPKVIRFCAVCMIYVGAKIIQDRWRNLIVLDSTPTPAQTKLFFSRTRIEALLSIFVSASIRLTQGWCFAH